MLYCIRYTCNLTAFDRCANCTVLKYPENVSFGISLGLLFFSIGEFFIGEKLVLESVSNSCPRLPNSDTNGINTFQSLWAFWQLLHAILDQINIENGSGFDLPEAQAAWLMLETIYNVSDHQQFQNVTNIKHWTLFKEKSWKTQSQSNVGCCRSRNKRYVESKRQSSECVCEGRGRRRRRRFRPGLKPGES